MKNLKLNFILLFAVFLGFTFYFLRFSEAFAQESSTYKLKGYEFGGGGGTDIESTTYSLEGIVGEGAGELSSTTYKSYSGLTFVQNANVPPAPTFVNSANWYNKLKITINKDAGDPSDVKYAIAVSTDDFATTQWVQSDTNTLSSALGSEDFQSYTDWGGATGEFIIGLSPNVTYKAKVTSTQGKYTQSMLSASATAATVNVSLEFDLDVSSTDTETAAPYSVSLGEISIGSVTTAANKVWIDFETNAEYGGYVYISDQHSGLRSANVNYTINSATVDLAGVSEGYGIRNSSVSQTSGGPITALSPYSGASENVGLVNTTTREIYSSSAAPVVGGRSSFFIKAKGKTTTPSASDFSDTLTIVASATF